MSSLHKLLCSLICALALASTSAPPVRAASPAATVAAVVPLADGWSWREFWKFWGRQLGKTSGVVGVVLLIGIGAMLLILAKTRY